MTAKASARLQIFLAGLCFGLMATLARMASAAGPGPRQGFTGPQMSLARFAVSTGLALALFGLRPGTLRVRRPGLLAVRGTLGGLSVLLYFVALTTLPAGEATLLNNLYPVFATLIAVFALGERASPRLAVAIAAVSAGVALLVGPGAQAPVLGLGVLAGVLSGASGGGAVTAVRALRADHNAATIFFAFSVCGALVSLPFTGGCWPTAPRLWALAAAVGALSFAGQLLVTHAYGALTVPEAALWQQLTPVAGYGFGLLLLGEEVSALAAVGIALGIGGVAYGTAAARPAVRPVEG